MIFTEKKAYAIKSKEQQRSMHFLGSQLVIAKNDYNSRDDADIEFNTDAYILAHVYAYYRKPYYLLTHTVTKHIIDGVELNKHFRTTTKRGVFWAYLFPYLTKKLSIFDKDIKLYFMQWMKNH